VINPEFVAETDKIIEKIQERGIQLENGNVLVAKVKLERRTPGGLVLSEDSLKKEDYKNGLARILALPSNLGLSEGDAKLKVGDYIMHTHEARYLPYVDSIREVLDVMVDKEFIYAVQDAEVILTIGADKFKV
jgi:co-chaperonin GroES (HSP10)